jgi:para-nitrobenzyl esterase
VTAEANTRRAADDRPVVDTAHGPVRGVDNGTVKVWKGIRYAAAPVGDLRWRAPEAPQRWSEPADATRVGPVCPQPTDPRIPIDLGAPQGDDCLTLNVWASSDTDAEDAKPVMVWVHGGAYILGSSAQTLYHGGVLAGGGDAVIVTVNYRLGALGFLDLSSFGDSFGTNLGLRDVLFALQWVRQHRRIRR